jgi:iron complex transport system substrate-binding protein
MPNAVSIGEGSSPDIEKIITLRPDVVLLMSTSNPTLAEKLQGANISYAYIDGYKLANIPDEIRILGILTSHTGQANRYIAFYSTNHDLVNGRLSSVSAAERPRVYFEGNSDYSTVGKTSGGDSLIRMAYGKNIGSSLGVPWPIVSPEWVMSQDPQVVIKIAYPSTLNNSTISGIFHSVIMRPSLNSTSAGRDGRVYVLHHRVTYNTQGIVSLVYLAKAMYPELFTDIDPDEILLEYDREFLPGSYLENSFYPKFWKNQSGFSP